MKITYKTIIKKFIVFSFLLLLFQSPLTRCGLPSFFTMLINSYDEMVALLCAVIMIFYLVKVGIPKGYGKELVLFFLFVLIGIMSTLVNGMQPFQAVIEDVINCSKFVVTYLGLEFIHKKYDSQDILELLQNISKWLVYFFFALTVIDILFPQLLFSNTSFRYGIHAVHLFYYHPAVLAQVMVLLISVLSFETSKEKNIVALKVMCLIVLATTLRGKAFGFIFFYLFLWGYEKLKIGKAKIILVLLAIFTIGFVVSDNIDKYYRNETSARATLTADGWHIANERFPLGLGFGTFASAPAAKYYSPVYNKLGYLSRYGMGYINTNYLTDSFWPILLGQFGYIGTLLYGGIIVALTRRCAKLSKRNKNAAIAELSLVGYLLISSMAATAFFNPISIPNALLIVLELNAFNEKEKHHKLKMV